MCCWLWANESCFPPYSREKCDGGQSNRLGFSPMVHSIPSHIIGKMTSRMTSNLKGLDVDYRVTFRTSGNANQSTPTNHAPENLTWQTTVDGSNRHRRAKQQGRRSVFYFILLSYMADDALSVGLFDKAE
uniref:Uncharacterized protein n=1 Tax=Octactis speculum TaxID=3111310 RepID=A0A7S2F5S9_9STRA